MLRIAGVRATRFARHSWSCAAMSGHGAIPIPEDLHITMQGLWLSPPYSSRTSAPDVREPRASGSGTDHHFAVLRLRLPSATVRKRIVLIVLVASLVVVAATAIAASLLVNIDSFRPQLA